MSLLIFSVEVLLDITKLLMLGDHTEAMLGEVARL